MKHLIVYAHPHTDSLNNAILNTAVEALKAQGHEVVVRDLYKLGFQPVLTEADTASMRAGQTPQDIRNRATVCYGCRSYHIHLSDLVDRSSCHYERIC